MVYLGLDGEYRKEKPIYLKKENKMSKWIKVYPKEIISLSFKSVWYYKHIPHAIDAFDYGNCKIKIRKIQSNKQK